MRIIAVEIDPRFKLGDHVMYRLYGNDQWRPVVLTRHATYSHGGTDGYYFYFLTGTATDPVTGVTPSQGGWAAVRYLRPMTEEEIIASAEVK